NIPVMWNDLITLIFPEVCIGCNILLAKGEDYLCTECRSNLPIIPYNQYETQLFHQKLLNSYQYDFAYAFLKFYKSGVTQRIMHALKYNNQPLVAEFMGRLAANEMRNEVRVKDYNYIIPVPLHPRKKIKRGYNQSDFFARGLSLSLNISWSGTLIQRMRNTSTQTKKSREERQANVEGVFAVNNPSCLSGGHIILVDDVATTGATLDACSNLLYGCGVSKISVCTIASAQ
ncbi:ComF family protein, partial [Bacteroidota bacterium]